MESLGKLRYLLIHNSYLSMCMLKYLISVSIFRIICLVCLRITLVPPILLAILILVQAADL